MWRSTGREWAHCGPATGRLSTASVPALRIGLAALAVAVSAGAGAGAAAADTGTAEDEPWHAEVDIDPRLSTLEAWTGGDATGTQWAIYSGLTWAPAGTLLDDGVRIRLAGAAAYGSYRSLARTSAGIGQLRYRTSTLVGQLMLGYQLSFGPITLKAFGGVMAADKHDTPHDPSDPDQRLRYGATLALESWLDLGAFYVQTDTSWQQIDQTASGRVRVGWRVVDALSIGPEISAGRTLPTAARSPSVRTAAGAFARYAWDSGEVSASAGAADEPDRPVTGYATLQYLTKY